MSVLSWIGLKSDPTQDAANKAADQKTRTGQQASVAFENYRQAARDQANKLLNLRMTPYQAYSNRLAALTGSGMSTAGLSQSENPLTLQETGIGAPVGSNYASQDISTPMPDGQGHAKTHIQGIGEQIGDMSAAGQGPAAIGTTAVGRGDNRMTTTGVAPQNAEVASYLNPQTSSYMPSQAALPQNGGYQSPSAGYQFMPRRVP